MRSAHAGSLPVEAQGQGQWRGTAFSIKGRSESLLKLTNTDHPLRIRRDASAVSTHASVSGTVTHPLQLRNFNLQLVLNDEDMEELYLLIGLAIPSTPPCKLDEHLKRDNDLWRYDDFTGKVGDSDLAGNAKIDVSTERPALTAELVSKRLDFDDLAGFIGAPPRTGAGETANAQQKAKTAALAASARVLPQTPYELGKLRAMDADVRWEAQRINSPSLPLDDMDVHLLLNAGILRLDPLNFGIAGGDIRATVRMDARNEHISTQLHANQRKLQLGQLLPGSTLAQQASGVING